MRKTPSTALCFLPLISLIGLLALNVYIFGDNALGGANQLILLTVAVITAFIAWRLGYNWKDLEGGIVNSITVAAPAILILLMVGALSGTWLLSGVVPAMIYYGLYVLDPSIFLFACCIISVVVSLSTGSSWTTSATVGIALMGIGSALGFNPAMVAGAILSGAYFGDKMSPLSDTTNLASAIAGTDLFTHIRYMTITTGPSILIALIVFIVLGLGAHGESSNTGAIRQALADTFNLSPVLLLAPVVVIAMILKRVPALPALVAGAILGAALAVVFQRELLATLAEQGQLARFPGYAVVLTAFFGDTTITTGNEVADELLSSGGMAGMLNTIWLILCAMILGGVLEAAGFLRAITAAITKKVHSAAQLIAATTGTSLFTNITASDQYLAIIVPGQMYRQAYQRQGLQPQNLSRTLEDSATVTSVLIPWNTCGAFHASVLGVATLSYLPFAVFCYLSPLMTLACAFTGFKLARCEPVDANSGVEQSASVAR
ncbi:Na+/H+ antiporter NhaC [Teredinibacter turnerae]|uniref:Na+/H+ antiporter NhaC n=1 Tax=Teredinibacter turnerae TaxID=2426 RepID=UPI0030CDC652